MRLTRSSWALGVCLICPSIAGAQTSTAVLSQGPDRKWEVAVQVGAGGTTSPGGGTGTLPAPGPTFAIGSINTSRQVSSWFFGDGAAVLNANLSRFVFGARMSPIDGMLTSTADMGGLLTISGTATRTLTSRLAIEFGVSVDPKSLALSNAAMSQLSSATTSFETSFDSLMQLLSTEDSPQIDAQSTVDEPSGMHITAGAGVRFLLAHRGPTKPYVNASFGVSSVTGGDMVTTVIGRYDFVRRISPLPRFQETDTVTIRHHADTSWYSAFGVGFLHDLGERYGIRAEVAFSLFPDPVRISIDAIPTRVITDPTGAAILSGTPGLSISTTPAVLSNLSLETNNFETFSGTDLRLTTRATAGVFFRF